jgi:murein DD-endopeptidase MepM/ murein hydrolase activator NlpD
MKIEIEIPQPKVLLAILAMGGWWYYTTYGTPGHLTASVTPPPVVVQQVAATGSGRLPADYGALVGSGQTEEVQAVGANTTARQEMVKRAEEEARLARLQQEVIKRKADILRGELRVLEGERRALGDKIDPSLERQFQQSSALLVALLQDQKKAEQFLLASFNQIWEAQGRAIALGLEPSSVAEAPILQWSVVPRLGISALFHDPTYKERFGFDHDAIDIPVPQGSIVRAAAGGTVTDVVDHGLGFNYVTIRHNGGVVTLYGHLTKFSVHVGDHVSAGDPIGLSGGRPGTLGAGLSTGPHLHFGVFKNGVAIDPQSLLPESGPPEVAMPEERQQ